MTMLTDLENFVKLQEWALQARRDAEDVISDCTEIVLWSRRLIAQSSADRYSRAAKVPARALFTEFDR